MLILLVLACYWSEDSISCYCRPDLISKLLRVHAVQILVDNEVLRLVLVCNFAIVMKRVLFDPSGNTDQGV